jgi:hypothetical protein
MPPPVVSGSVGLWACYVAPIGLMPDSADGPYDLSVRHVADVIPSVAFGHDHVASGTVAMRMCNFLGSGLGNFDRRSFEGAKRFLNCEDRPFHG